MRILQKILVLVMTVILTNSTVIKAFTSSSLGNNRNIVNVGVLLYSFDDMYMSQIKQNLEHIQKNNENIVKFTFFDCKNNQAIQNQILDSLSTTSFNLLFVDLIDTKEIAIKEVIYKAKEKDISLIIFNIDPSSISDEIQKYYNKVFFLITDSKQLGTLQGDILVKQWNSDRNLIDKNKDNIIEYITLQGTPTSPIAFERTKSAISTLNYAGIQTQQLELKNAYWDKQIAETVTESLILKYGNRIEVIISNNDAMAIGAIQALQKYGYNQNDKSKYVSVVGIDALQEAKELINKGIMTGTVTQDPAAVTEALYKVGTNLLNNTNPLEGTNYELNGKEIIKTMSYQQYVKQ